MNAEPPIRLIPHYSQHTDYGDSKLHMLFLSDQVRVEAYAQAIRETVQAGDVVVDIGTGPAVLAMLAARAGARRVYAIEGEARVIPMTQQIIDQAGLGSVITLLQGISQEITLPEPTDVIVSELIGGLGNDEGMVPALEDARDRFLRPETGRMVPRAVDVYIAPVEAPEAHAQTATVYDHDLVVPPEGALGRFEAYYSFLGGVPPDRLLAAGQPVDHVDHFGTTEASFARTRVFEISKPGVFSGFVAWFIARLSDHVVLDVSPGNPGTCWGQAYLPLPEQVVVQCGDRVELTFEAILDAGETVPHYFWTSRITREDQEIAAGCAGHPR
ncbi:MAG: hypothetical protein FJX75_08295 [Armatimonadetes bacterium]|nr:hypothetical protein [Armatimonadota bacterium]